jgi:hypothetical protein
MCRDQRVLAHLVDELMPEVSDSLIKAGIQLQVSATLEHRIRLTQSLCLRFRVLVQVVTVEWFMCLMCTVLPTATALRVWDAVFFCGAEGKALYVHRKIDMSMVASCSVISCRPGFVFATQGSHAVCCCFQH